MRKASHRLNEQILDGLADPRLEGAATTLDAMESNLLAHLQQTKA